MLTVDCREKCCKLIKTLKEINEPAEYLLDKRPRLKSGILIMNSKQQVLISQSYNDFWGIPKGAKEINETLEETCIRETKEETGIDLSSYSNRILERRVFLLRSGVYIIYFLRLHSDITIDEVDPYVLGTESTGFGWININCLKNMFDKSLIKLNYITKLSLEIVSEYTWAAD